ncbi:MAG: formimidoylglutamase [Flavobacteriales bacterium]|nr:formimidoylglutamase [Flavobacteriales bacterium]
MSWVDDIAYFLSPLDEYFTKSADEDDNRMGATLLKHTSESFPDIDSVKFAILGVNENRRSQTNFEPSAPDAVRVKFYELYSPFGELVGVDLGNIKPGETPDDTDAALKQIAGKFASQKIPLIVLGGSQDLTFALHQGFESLETSVNHTVIDSRLDLGEFRSELSVDNYLSKMVLHDPSYLFSLTILGYQAYYADPKVIELMDKMYFDHIRLGDLKATPEMAEPVLRNSDMLSFDMSAIKDEAAPGTFEPNGLNGEIACKIMRYAGLSDKVAVAGLFNYNLPDDFSGQQATLMAQMIWYFIEGLQGRIREFPLVKRQNFLEYKVQLPEYADDLVFFKSKRTDKWWMKIPYMVKGSKYAERHHLVPCGYADYESASNGEMPDLWWKTFRKLS